MLCFVTYIYNIIELFNGKYVAVRGFWVSYSISIGIFIIYSDLFVFIMVLLVLNV